MSQYSFSKFDDFTCSGPRPPVPGEESRRKMTDTLHPDKSRTSPPAYCRWANNVSYLLDDSDGAELFKRFVELEDEEHLNHLNFYFACQGLKRERNPERMLMMIGVIYRKFLKRAPRGSPMYVDEEMRVMIKAGLRNDGHVILTPDVFDQMQENVVSIISSTTYPNFLQSDLYLQYVQNMQTSSGSGSGGGSCISIPLGVAAAAAASSSSAGGAVSSMTSSSSTSELISYSSSALPTLHEDSELLVNADSIEQLYGATGPAIAASSLSVTSGVSGSGSASSCTSMSTSKPAMTLTKDALRATEKRRLEMRPSGPRAGFSVYTKYSSYNPVSRRDSEQASLSSGRTDSDTMSLSSISTDGRPHPHNMHRNHHQASLERRLIHENAMVNSELNRHAIIPRTQRMNQKPLPKEEFVSQLMSKLEKVKKLQDNDELLGKKLQEADQSTNSQSNKFFAEQIRQKLQVEDETDQDILDQHVSRVFSDLTPNRSPGRVSPSPNINRARRHEMGSFGSMSAQSSMRHSKSMPEGHQLGLMGPPAQPHPRKLSNKWPSVNTDSGISLFSSDTLTKYSNKDMQCASTSTSRPLSRTMHCDMSVMNTATLLQESSRRLEDETRRSKRYQHSGQPMIQTMPLPPLPPSAMTHPSSLLPPPIPAKPSQGLPGVQRGMPVFQQPPPPAPATAGAVVSAATTTEFTVVVYSFCDEEVPYRIKIPGSNPPTLRQFKEYLPKKGNYRFFFKTRCDDVDNPVYQEEINNDNEMLPLFEGKVMGTVKPIEV
ncbi:axin isoform X1 [Culex pipiens pallens]|uniref:axin isoform X1 n=1 Tax=Culex pipiens pallens TaxID=42434 RepID=UPI00195302B5|nr:axin isoform X1 [Culex pipiens pallens]XP_039453524.1 axin isoform X1 [Culex pipiens pallens]